MWEHSNHVITCAKFQIDIFMGYDFTWGRICDFPITGSAVALHCCKQWCSGNKKNMERSDESPPQAEKIFGPAHCCRWVLVHFWWTEIDLISVIFKSTFYFFRQRGTNMRLIVCFYQKITIWATLPRQMSMHKIIVTLQWNHPNDCVIDTYRCKIIIYNNNY